MPRAPVGPEPEWEFELNIDPDWLRVRNWRRDMLEAGGFSEFTAYRIALRFDVEYRAAIEMLEGGATELQVTDLLID